MTTDKYDEMAAIAGKAGGLDEKQWPGLAIILRGVRAEALEQAAKVAENCDTLGPSYQDHELTPDGLHARKKVRQIAKAIRSLLAPPLKAGE